MKAYKLLRKRRDGSLGPLFCHRSLRVPFDVWLPAEDRCAAGLARRPGWHCTLKPEAPHLSMETKRDKRVWLEVEVEDFKEVERPPSQGGTWILANRIKFIRELP